MGSPGVDHHRNTSMEYDGPTEVEVSVKKQAASKKNLSKFINTSKPYKP